MLGEFDGIADQVDQNLTQPAGVTHHSHGHIGVNIAHQLQAFGMRPHGQRPEHFADGAAQVERDFLDQQLARFDLGEIKNVIDHREQRL